VVLFLLLVVGGMIGMLVGLASDRMHYGSDAGQGVQIAGMSTTILYVLY
jgi:hypothetical protein